jgi:5-methylcytosine-specific restriction endonuclease McrA
LDIASDTKENRYLLRFNSFFNSEKLSSTYKPVFVKSLLAISDYDERNLQRLVGHRWITKQNDKLKVHLNFIAVRYIRYFWELYFKFRLKQSHSPQDANINRILRKLKNVSKTPSFSSLAGEEFSSLRQEVIRDSIKPEVLFHLDRRQDLYERVLHKDYIILHYCIIPFFKKYKGILISALNFMITRYLEKINFVPRIAEKVSGSIPRTYLTSKEMQIILKIHNSCFYCNAKALTYYMDHVIPFNFIYQTEVFNIVPACINCNSRKSDRLPTQEIFNRVIQRNRNLTLRDDYTNDWYQKLYESCMISYQGSRLPFSP